MSFSPHISGKVKSVLRNQNVFRRFMSWKPMSKKFADHLDD
jgi:hypothetical protein